MFGRAGHGPLGALFVAPACLKLGVKLRRVRACFLNFVRADTAGKKRAA